MLLCRYNGDDDKAIKAAGHELRGLISYYQCHMKNLHFPLMVLVDYMGYRLIAQSILPIERSTIIYGSYNAGRTVYDLDPGFNRIMAEAARKLNLKAHWVGPKSGLKLLHAPVDIEGHRGTDSRYYLIDFGRVFPPEYFTQHTYQCGQNLYYQLRPELLRQLNFPLSSDALSNFGHNGLRAHNDEVRRATEVLLFQLIPSFARWLTVNQRTMFCTSSALHSTSMLQARQHRQSVRGGPRRGSDGSLHAGIDRFVNGGGGGGGGGSGGGGGGGGSGGGGTGGGGYSRDVDVEGCVNAADDGADDDDTMAADVDDFLLDEDESANDGTLTIFDTLVSNMHRTGINLRHVGRVRMAIPIDKSTNDIRGILLTEMIARVVKHIIHHQLREKRKALCTIVDSPYIGLVVRQLNVIFSPFHNIAENAHFWHETVKIHIAKRYPDGLTPEENSAQYDLRSSNIHLVDLLQRAATLTGIKLQKQV